MKPYSTEKKSAACRIFHVRAAGNQLRVQSIEPQNAEFTNSRSTLVFLHEGLGCIELWRDFPETLCTLTACTGLVYERKGYGGSEKLSGPWPLDYLQEEALTCLPQLLEACQVDDAILIGHSDGGTIALITASNQSDLVRGVITESAHIFVEDITTEGIRNAVKAFETTNLKDKLARYHKENTETIFFRWADRWLSPEFYNWNVEEYLPKVTCPVLVFQGEDDEYGTSAQVEGIARLVSGPVEARLIPNCGHTPHFQAKDTVLAEMTYFIKILIS